MDKMPAEKEKEDKAAAKEKAAAEKKAVAEAKKAEKLAAAEAAKIQIAAPTRKKGEGLGFTFAATKTKVTVSKGDTVYAIDPDPKVALDTAIANEEAGTPYKKNMDIPEDYRRKYASQGESCGDDMANALKEACTKIEKTPKGKDKAVLDVDAMNKVAKANGVDMAKYDHLNVGQRRMNLGNRLRGLLKAGTDVTVGKQVFKAEDLKT